MSSIVGMAVHKAMRMERARTLALWLLALLLAASIGVLTAEPAHADTYFVNSPKDRVDNNPGNGECWTGVNILIDDIFLEKECTLRAAIQEANAVAGGDTINFGITSAEFSECNSTTNVCTISPTRKLPTITRPLTIDGYSEFMGASVNTAATGTNAVLKIVLDGSKAGSTPSNPVDGLYVTAPNTTIRGLVINNGFGAGVFFEQETPSDRGRTLEGCFIGTDVTGTSAKGNGVGVIISHGEGNVIGGTTLDARNLISGNSSGEGILIGEAANGNSIQGNLIGTKKDGTTALGNFTGVRVIGGSNNTIGGNGAARNTIAFNGFHGVQVQGSFDPSAGTGNRILFNSIHSNGELGIQLAADAGVTPNDPDDPDTGANTLQNFPVITSATTFGATTTIQGRLNSTPNQTFTVQFFSSPTPDPSGFGEGKTFLGQLNNVSTNANGNASFSFVPAQKVPVGHRVTATATGVGGTSEFSRARPVERPVIEG